MLRIGLKAMTLRTAAYLAIGIWLLLLFSFLVVVGYATHTPVNTWALWIHGGCVILAYLTACTLAYKDYHAQREQRGGSAHEQNS